MTQHERILRSLCRCIIVRLGLCPDRFKQDQTIFFKEVMVASYCRNGSIYHRNIEDAVPTQYLGFLEDKVREDLEVRSELQFLC
jgi:hypothetical protein